MFYSSKPRHIHLEPTRDCNARCPQCMRTDNCTLNTIPDLILDEVSATELGELLDTSSFNEVDEVLISGNYGDIMMHTHPKQLLEVLLERNIKVWMNTNGGAQSEEFWSWLGTTGIEVEFGIDGLEDTHHLYRRNTRYDVVMKNAKIFIDAGGFAYCAMNVFRHNEHQKQDLARVCKELGFVDIKYRADERFGSSDGLACYDNKGNVTHYLHPTNAFGTIKHKSKQSLGSIGCRVIDKPLLNKVADSIYISGEMKTWPCCWMEMAKPLENNNLREDSFDTINEEFYQEISSKWDTPGCLDVCNRKCGI